MANPVLSMTGFGRATKTGGGVTLEVEIRSVNHRFFDLSLKTPRLYTPYEAEVRTLLSERISRGRVEVFVSRRATDASSISVSFNKDLFLKLSAIYKEALALTNKEKVPSDTVLQTLNRREVLDITEDTTNIGAEKALLFETITDALTGFSAMRSQEGAHLKEDLVTRIEKVRTIANSISETSKNAPNQIRERYTQRLQKLAPEITIDPLRLAAEIAILADRVDTTEEHVRLQSHLTQFTQTLNAGKGCGRRLDFIIQELGRELNTITSKAQDAAIQHLVIDAKTEVERIREQVQNVE